VLSAKQLLNVCEPTVCTSLEIVPCLADGLSLGKHVVGVDVIPTCFTTVVHATGQQRNRQHLGRAYHKMRAGIVILAAGIAFFGDTDNVSLFSWTVYELCFNGNAITSVAL